MLKQSFSFLIAAILGGAIAIGGNNLLNNNTSQVANNPSQTVLPASNKTMPSQFVTSQQNQGYPDFTVAAEEATPAVVNITSIMEHKPRNAQEQRYYQFFGTPRPSESTGSGVIINKDGYIVTNNHVIQGSTVVEVTLHDKRKFRAQVIGTDPSTDLAVLKIEAQDLHTLDMADSDDAKIGEWVLAVGNPFELTSTVTAGIISAKARDISILSGRSSIESFIQTDAAVNPGNSGGALINTKGELLGINTAIATPTGTYAGYSFAVPTNLVKKVVQDLIDFGEVKRGFLGVIIREVDAEVADELNLSVSEGVYVSELVEGGGAEEAGMLVGDVIVSANNQPIKSVPELQEKIGSRNPGDAIPVKVIRNNKEKLLTVRLKD